MRAFWKTESIFFCEFVCAAAFLVNLGAPHSFAQTRIEEKVFEAFRRREEATPRLSVKLKIETKTQAGFHLHDSPDSTRVKPFPTADDTTLLTYSLLLDTSKRHKIESEGPRFQQEIFGNVKEYRVDLQTEKVTKSMWKTSAFDAYPELSRVTVYTKTFQSDKNFELLPFFMVYRPRDTDLNRERKLFQFKFAREDSIGDQKAVVLSAAINGSLHELWLGASDDYPLLRFRQQLSMSNPDFVKDRPPFLEIDLQYGEPHSPGVSTLVSWRTTYTVDRGRVGLRQNEMKGIITDFQLPESIVESDFDFKPPPIHVINDHSTNKSYLQLANGDRLPVNYSRGDTPKSAIKRVLDSTKK